MAETITEHHIPSLVASPSLDVTHDSAGDYSLDIFDDSEFPFARGVINGVKCCSKCGATKTPQWREGPFGPKTLCNACGVKRTRKLRAEQDGGKRRKVSVSPAKVYAKVKPAYTQGELEAAQSPRTSRSRVLHQNFLELALVGQKNLQIMKPAALHLQSTTIPSSQPPPLPFFFECRGA